MGGLSGSGSRRGRGWVRVMRVGGCVTPSEFAWVFNPLALRLGRLWGSAGRARGLKRDLPHQGHSDSQGPVPT